MLDLSNQRQVSQIMPSDDAFSPGEIEAVTTQDGRHIIYAVDSSKGVRVFDLTDPAAPITGAIISIPGANEIAIGNNVAYVQSGGSRDAPSLYVLDLTDPLAPTLSGPVPNFSLAYLICLGDVLIGSEGLSAIRLSDLSDPLVPREVGTIPLISSMAQAYTNGHLMVLKDPGGLAAIDIQHPAAPQIAMADIPMVYSSPAALAAAGNYALLGTLVEGWRVLEVADPTHPHVISTISLTSGTAPYGAVLEETSTTRTAYLFSGCWDTSLCDKPTELGVYDVSEPAHPWKLGAQRLPHAGPTVNFVVHGGYAYATWYGLTPGSYCSGCGWLEVFDVRDKANPHSLGRMAFDGAPEDLAVTDGMAYVAAWQGGLQAIDVSDPAAPHVVSAFHSGTGMQVAAVAADGPVVYVATAYTGELFTLDMRDPTQPQLMDQRLLQSFGDALTLADDTLIASGKGLTIYRRGGTSAGMVRDLRGAPVPEVELAVASTPGLTASSTTLLATDLGGRFSGDLTLDGAVTLTPQFRSSAFWPPSRTVTSAASPLHFTLVGAPATAAVTPGKAITLVFSDTQGLTSTLSLPADALADASAITVQPQGVSDTNGLLVAGHAFAVNLSGTKARFTQPAILTLRYSRGDVRLISDLDALRLYRQTEAGWALAEENCAGASAATNDQAARQIQVAICAPGVYALLGPTERIFIPILAR
ncbi:MAG: hypothetical protein HGA19_22295 [Oscillochloris sp.]|nr:hypothetical protein [Oscillochloris sp.]